MASEWSNIHRDVLEYVQTKLDLADVLQCRAVCDQWRYVTRSHISSSLNSPPSPPSPPKSLIQQQTLILWDKNYDIYDYCFLYSFLDVKGLGQICTTSTQNQNSYLTKIPKSKQLLNQNMGQCVGYSHGWFLFLDLETYCLRLFHPLLFSGAAASFPLISTPCGKLPRKIKQAVLMADPVSASGGNYSIVVIYEHSKGFRRLYYAKCGSTRLVPLGNGSDKQYDNMYDIISFNSYVYGIMCPDVYIKHRVVAWDFTGEGKDSYPRLVLDFEAKVMSNALNPVQSRGTCEFLVESEGELLRVSLKKPDLGKLLNIEERERIGFTELYIHARSREKCRVYKMDFKGKRWVDLDSLGDRVLFITYHQTMSLSTREFPQYQKNSIYFDHWINLQGCDPVIGVFNLEDGSMREIDIKA